MPKASKKADKKAAVTPTLYDVLAGPVVTEKSQMGVEQNKITFKVAPWATKKQIKQAVEAIFEVAVTKVNVLTSKGKVKRFRGTIGKRKDEKKAVVTVAEGQNIDIAAV